MVMPMQRRLLNLTPATLTVWLLLGFALALLPRTGACHGGLSMDEDYCKLRVGRYVMHFVGYQPESPNATKEFCEDIPATGQTIIVLDFIDDELRDLPAEVRIVKDVGEAQDLEAITVFHLPAKLHPTGSLSLEYDFKQAGKYVGLVTVGGKDKIVSRFPFSVGKQSLLPQVLGGVVLVAAAAALYLFALRQRARRPKTQGVSS